LGFGEGVEREKGIHSKNISHFYECCLSKPFQPFDHAFRPSERDFFRTGMFKKEKNMGV